MDVRLDSTSSMRFRYLRDPLFLGASLIYGLNRFVLKTQFGSSLPFLRNHLDDCLLIPAALPPLLWVFRKTGLRSHDAPPTLGELVQWTLLWSVAFEWAFPRFFHKGVADWWDVASYALGAFLAGILWN